MAKLTFGKLKALNEPGMFGGRHAVFESVTGWIKKLGATNHDQGNTP